MRLITFIFVVLFLSLNSNSFGQNIGFTINQGNERYEIFLSNDFENRVEYVLKNSSGMVTKVITGTWYLRNTSQSSLNFEVQIKWTGVNYGLPDLFFSCIYGQLNKLIALTDSSGRRWERI
jgi:hypothetical protein